MYNVFDTEEEANTAQESDFQTWKAYKMPTCNCPEYWDQTTSWGEVRQRLTDSKFVYPVCPQGSQEHTQEQYQNDWFNVI